MIWTEAPARSFLSSHRLVSVMTHGGGGSYGRATGRPVRSRIIADCRVQDGRVKEEWGRHARNLGDQAYRRHRQLYFAGAALHAPGGRTLHGHGEIDRFVIGYLASFPDARFTLESATANRDPERPVRVALRWSLAGTHAGFGHFGPRSGAPVRGMGLTHGHLTGARFRWSGRSPMRSASGSRSMRTVADARARHRRARSGGGRGALRMLACLSLLGARDAPPVATFTDFRYEAIRPNARAPKPGPGEFLNPIIGGSRSDPTIVRVGRDFYLAHTSFGDWPGGPIWRSRDLIHWKLIGHAFTHPDAPDLSRIDPGWQGVWTNDLKYHDGWFYLSGVCYACGGIFVMRSRDPAGPWPKPTFLPLEGVDASFFFDEDGRSYITHNGIPPGGSRYEGHRAIWLQAIDVATMTLTGEHTLLVDGGTHPPDKPYWIEGEHLFRKDGRYYLIAAQGGTNENHSEVVFRSDRLRGPYVAGPNPILTQLGLDPGRPDPVANAGHADFVQTPAGDWWAVFLGARPYGRDPLDFATGRETFLLPVSWRDGWPMILPPGQAVPILADRPRLPDAPVAEWPTAGDYAIADRFGGPELSPRWSLLRTSAERWWRTGAGGLRITPRAVELGAKEGQPSFVGFRQAHGNAVATVSVSFAPTRPSDRAGLAAVQDERRWFFVAVTAGASGGRQVRLIRRNGNDDPREGVTLASAPLPAGAAPVRLRIVIEGPSCRFAYAPAGKGWHALGGTQDASILSNRIAGGFTGVMLGPVAIAAP